MFYATLSRQRFYPTVLTTSIRKRIFVCRLILSDNFVFVLTDLSFYLKSFFFCASICSLISNIYPKLKFTATNRSDLYEFYGK